MWMGIALGLLAAACGVLFYFNPTQHSFYPICMFHKYTGLNCPGCGSLRAMHLLVHGDVVTALRFNPLLILSLPFVACYSLVYVKSPARAKMWLSAMVRPRWMVVMLVVLILFTVLRNIPVTPFIYLGPP